MFRYNRVTVCVAAAAALSLSGCASWFKKDPAFDDPVALHDIRPAVQVKTAWSYAIGKAGVFTFAPVVAGDSVYAASAGGNLVRLDAQTGRLVWSIDAKMKLTSAPGTDGKVVAIGAEKGTLLTFDAQTGKPLWKAQAGAEILSAPAVGENLVIVRSEENLLATFDEMTGGRGWTVQRSLPPLTLSTVPGILILPQAAIVNYPGGAISAINLATGAPWWESPVGIPRGVTEMDRISDASGKPLKIGQRIFSVSYQGHVAGYDGGTGTIIWDHPFSSAVGLGTDPARNVIYAAGVDGKLQAYNVEDGRSLWQNADLGYRKLTRPAGVGRMVAVGDLEGYVHFLDASDGKLAGRVRIDSSPVLPDPAVAGNLVIFQSRDGKLVALTSE